MLTARDDPRGKIQSRPAGSLALRAWVGQFWAGGASSLSATGAPTRERVLPTGHAHLVLRLAGPPLRLYDSPHDQVGATVAHCIVGGPRDAAYLRGLDQTTGSVGVELRPGAVQALFRVPATELAGAHWSLEDFWGRDAARLRERLLDAGDTGRQIAILEETLLCRLPAMPALHPAVALALARLARGVEVHAIVRESGYSHRRLLSLFRAAVGHTPQAWLRILRFRRAVAGLRAGGAAASVAAEAGFADQPHLNREFRRIAGLTPAQYARLRPAQPNHVPGEGW